MRSYRKLSFAFRSWLMATLSIASSASAFAGASSGMEVKGVWGGLVQAVFVEPSNPDIVYIGSGRRLVILSVTDAGPGHVNVVELGSIDLGSLVFDIAVRNGYAWVATRGLPNYFCVVDVHNPAQPQLKWSNQGELIISHAQEVDLYGDMAYVRTGSDLVYYRISDFEADPLHNVPQAIDVAVGSLVREVQIEGTKLYLVTDNATLREFRVYTINPDYSVTQCAMLPLPSNGSGQALAVDGAGACATMELGGLDHGTKLAMFDIANPCAPVLRSQLSGFSSSLRDVALSNGYAFLPDWAGHPPDPVSWGNAKGLAIYDIHTNPTQPPALVGQYHPHGAIAFVKVYGSRAYVTDDARGLVVLDVSTPANPIKAGEFYSPSYLRKMDLVDDLLYVSDAWGGFAVLNVGNPQVPQLAGIYNTPALGLAMNNWAVRVLNQRAYLSAGYGGIEVVDVSDPAQPTFLGARRMAGLEHNTIGFEVVDGAQLSPDWQGHIIGSFAMPYGSTFAFRNVDLTNPANPLDVGPLLFTWPLFDLEAGGSYLHVAGMEFGGPYFLLNNENPSDPQLSSRCASSLDVAISGDYLCSANRSSVPQCDIVNGLKVYDISSPGNPVAIPGSNFASPTCSGVDVHGSRAYLTGQDSNNNLLDTLFELDVTNPGAPTLLSKVVITHYGRAVVVGNGIAVVATEDNGLVIVSTSVTPGDMNADDVIDGGDLQDFVSVLLNPGGFQSDIQGRADMDENSVVNTADLPLFVTALLGSTDPVGACCLPYGGTACAMYTQVDCAAHGGTYHGDGVACESVACRGACCYADGDCILRSAQACAASNGTYQGDGSTCLGACPAGLYQNEINPVTSYATSGSALRIADDMTLEGTGARLLSGLSLAVYGGNVGQPFDVTVKLYDGCPGAGGQPYPNVFLQWFGVPDYGGYYILDADPLPQPQLIGDTVWMEVEFSSLSAGWIIAGPAEIGSTEDRIAANNPWNCNVTLGGGLYGGLWANLRCVAGAGSGFMASPEGSTWKTSSELQSAPRTATAMTHMRRSPMSATQLRPVAVQTP